MNRPSHIPLRLATLLFAMLLGLQCVWLLLTEFRRPATHQLPTDAAAAAEARSSRADATWAATVGAIRGELWAEAAFTYADLMWGDAARGADLTQVLARAHASVNRALDDAPHQSDVWLLLAGLALRYPLPNISAQEALKMSYYTGSSELDLAPMRLRIATHSETFSDIELREFISRDMRLLLAHQQTTALASAYNTASASGKHFIEQTVGDIDPTFAKSLRAGAGGQPLQD